MSKIDQTTSGKDVKPTVSIEGTVFTVNGSSYDVTKKKYKY